MDDESEKHVTFTGTWGEKKIIMMTTRETLKI